MKASCMGRMRYIMTAIEPLVPQSLGPWFPSRRNVLLDPAATLQPSPVPSFAHPGLKPQQFTLRVLQGQFGFGRKPRSRRRDAEEDYSLTTLVFSASLR